MRRIPLIICSCMLAIGSIWAQEIPTATTNVTKDDLLRTPQGREVKELNERMRKIAKDAETHDKAEDSYQLLRAGFEKLKKKRDEAGEDIRGLRGFEIVLHGEDAIGNQTQVRMAAIDFYIRNPRQRHLQPYHGYYNEGGDLIISVSPPGNEAVAAARKKSTKPPASETADRPREVIVTSPDYDLPIDADCSGGFMGQSTFCD